MKKTNLFSAGAKLLLWSNGLFLCLCSPKESDWKAANDALIQTHGLAAESIAGYSSPLTQTHAQANEIITISELPSGELHPGVAASLLWSSGFTGALISMEAGSSLPQQTNPSERIILMLEGSVEAKFSDGTKTLQALERAEPDGVNGATPKKDLIYIPEMTEVNIVSGPSGAKLLEVFAPLNQAYFSALGIDTPDIDRSGDSGMTPSIVPNEVYDLYDLQHTETSSGGFTKMISGAKFQLNLVSLHADSDITPHLIGSERVLIGLRGEANLSLAGDNKTFSKDNVTWIPANVVQKGSAGSTGVDYLEIIWPAHQRSLEAHHAKLGKYNDIIPSQARVEKILDGKKTHPELFFTEGPKWIDGKLYFSNMYFDKDFNGDPKRSSLIAMEPTGAYRAISQGQMQTNGLYPYKNGNFLACDMMGHRVVEMDKTGKVVRVWADTYNGKPIDGPNDLVVDAKGGFYFTDPQFTMDEVKNQPGRAVYYVSSEGKITRLTDPNEFAMPNGILLSPDGKTLYINNTYDDEEWYPVQSEKDNHVWAYDVQEDGTIQNGRKFCSLFMPENVLDRKGRSSGADGMAIDTEGNLYVATYTGVQIFDKEGGYIGTINLPTFPVSLCFGDEDMQSLYIVSYSNVYKIRTNRKGFVQQL